MNASPNPPSAVLLDLDGTLVDTAQDLARALTALLVAHHQTALPFETIRPTVSNGTPAMLGLAFGVQPSDSRFAELREQFLAFYAADIGRDSALFPGCQGLLDACAEHGITWGIVTNKPAHLTNPLMTAMNIQPAPGCIVSADETPAAKPHPAPLLYACKQLNLKPSDCVYVGDAERDIQAAHRAGMPAIAAAWGYIDADDDINSWRADRAVETPADLTALLFENMSRHVAA